MFKSNEIGEKLPIPNFLKREPKPVTVICANYTNCSMGKSTVKVPRNIDSAKLVLKFIMKEAQNFNSILSITQEKVDDYDRYGVIFYSKSQSSYIFLEDKTLKKFYKNATDVVLIRMDGLSQYVDNLDLQALKKSYVESIFEKILKKKSEKILGKKITTMEVFLSHCEQVTNEDSTLKKFFSTDESVDLAIKIYNTFKEKEILEKLVNEYLTDLPEPNYLKMYKFDVQTIKKNPEKNPDEEIEKEIEKLKIKKEENDKKSKKVEINQKKHRKILSEIARLCLSKSVNFDVGRNNGDGLTMLQESVMCQNKELFDILVRISDVEAKDNQEGQRTPFHIAVFQYGKFVKVLKKKTSKHFLKTLIKHKAKVDVYDGDGFTPLISAIQTGDLSIVQLLIDEFKADLNLRNSIQMKWPIHYAIESGNPDIVNYLIEQKANLDCNVTDISILSTLVQDWSCLQYAQYFNDSNPSDGYKKILNLFTN